MSKERFEIFGADDSIYKLIKDNEELPNLLNMELACVRMNEFVAKISDLEAKLAESEKMNKILYNEKESAEKILRMSSNEQTREILELKQQLAEKEKEISITKQLLENYRLQCHEFLKNETNVYSKSKTEFAIQQLQRVKENCQAFDGIELVGFIDQIIKELEGKDAKE